MRQVWVKLVGSGTERDPYRPDLPPGVGYSAAIPVETRPDHPEHGRPLLKVARVEIAEKDAALLGETVMPTALETGLTAGCHDALVARDSREPLFADGARAREVFKALAAQLAVGSEERRQVLGRALAEATRLGLRADAGQAIAADHDLADAATVAEIGRAAMDYEERLQRAAWPCGCDEEQVKGAGKTNESNAPTA